MGNRPSNPMVIVVDVAPGGGRFPLIATMP
jgi:hypothetical protein